MLSALRTGKLVLSYTVIIVLFNVFLIFSSDFGIFGPSLSGLPDELLLSIFKNLPAKTVLNVSQTCRRLNRVSKTNSLWRSLYLKKFGRALNEIVLSSCTRNRMESRMHYFIAGRMEGSNDLDQCWFEVKIDNVTNHNLHLTNFTIIQLSIFSILLQLFREKQMFQQELRMRHRRMQEQFEEDDLYTGPPQPFHDPYADDPHFHPAPPGFAGGILGGDYDRDPNFFGGLPGGPGKN